MSAGLAEDSRLEASEGESPRNAGSGRWHNPPIRVDADEERRLLDIDNGLIHSPTRAVVRLTIYLLFTLALIPAQACALAFKSRVAVRIPRFYHRTCLRIFGIDLTVRGHRSLRHPTLFVANHVSYLDIMVLGALLNCSFIAKQEVSSWPGFGLLAKLQETVFIQRKRSAVGRHADEIGERLAQGDNLVLFPEGTSGDGNHVLPFRSGYLGVADREVDGEPLIVQPMSIAYTRLNGVPIGRVLRPFFAWYGDMDLAPHLWRVVGLGRLSVVVEFQEPTTLKEIGSRKALARCARDRIAEGLARANSGRCSER